MIRFIGILKNLSKSSFFGSLLVLVLSFSFELKAQTSKVGDTEDHLDVVLLLDGSGSMRVTDPKRLREESFKMFVEFLKPGDRLALVEFAEQPKVLRELEDYKEEQDAQIIEVIQSVRDDGEYTDLLAPLQIAERLLTKEPRKTSKPVIVMLSDGKMDPDPKVGPAAVLTSTLTVQLLPKLKNKGIKVYTLSFSELADRALLSYIATATNGVPWFTPTSDQIHESFAELFLVLKKPQIVPLTSKGFRIDADVQEATFYVNRETGKEITLLVPDGTKVTEQTDSSSIKWFKGQQFDVVTVRKPKPGQWQVLGLPKNEGFATVLTQLKLATNWPTSVYAGAEGLLEVRMYESRKPVVLPEMTGVVRYAFRITPTDRVSEPVVKSFLVDDGTEGDKLGRDGVFSSKVVLDTPGEYKLQVVASGPTFERHQQLAFKVKPRLLSLSLVKGEDSLLGSAAASIKVEGSPEPEYFQLQASNELSSKKKLEVTLLAVSKEGDRYSLPLTKFDNVYEVATINLPHQGEFSVQGFFTAEGRRKGKLNRGESTSLNYVNLVEAPKDGSIQIVQQQAPQVIQIAGQTGPPKEPSEPWLIYLAVMSVVNIAVGSTGFLMSKKQASSGGDEAVEGNFKPNTEFEELAAQLEAIVAEVDVDLESDVFTNENLNIVTRDSPAEVDSTDVGEDTESDGEASDTETDSEAGTEEAPDADSETEAEAAEEPEAAGEEEQEEPEG